MGNRVSCAYSSSKHQVPSFNPMTVEVDKTETRFICNDVGNGLFAAADLESGDVIIRVKDAHVLIPQNSVIPNVCYGCLLEKTNLNSCTGCKVVKYCSKSCQTESWKRIHKLECKVFRKCRQDGHPIFPTPVRGLIQALLRHPSGTDPDPGWSHLKTHKENFMADGEIWQDIELQAWAAVQYIGLPMNMMDVATSIMCAFKVNAFSASQPDDTPVGLCFEPLFATANHSCVANAWISFDGRYVSFKALKPIQKGEEITIYYVDTNQPLEIRQRKLKERYFFTCKCLKCVADWDVYASFLNNLCRKANKPCMFSSYEQLETEALAVSSTETQGLAQNCEVISGIVKRANRERTPEETLGGLQLAFNLLKQVHWGAIIAAEPYPSVLRPLVDNYVVADEIEAALVLLLYTVFHVQPFEFPEPWNPIRVTTLRGVATLISQILAVPKYSLHRLLVIPPSLAFEVELFPCACAVLLLVAHYAPRSHGASSKFLEGVCKDLADAERQAELHQSVESLNMLKLGIQDGAGQLIASKYFRQLEKLADLNLMYQVIDTIDCAGNGHNGAMPPFRLP